MTGSMERAIEETDRRRSKQVAYNEEHGITPRGIQKKIKDIMEGAYGPGAKGKARQRGRDRKVAEQKAAYAAEVIKLSPAALSRKLQQMEDQMLEAAKNLEFEEAARLRDEMTEIKQQAFLNEA